MGGFCSSSQGSQTGNSYGYKNPLGPSASQGGSGANELQGSIFNYLQGYLPQSTGAANNYASALTSAASNPAWGAVTNNAEENAAGNYLYGSPALNQEMAWNTAQTQGNAANQNARIRNQMQQNGMAFSTTDQQAQEANNAAANAQSAATNANIYANNYQAERQNQNNAGTMLAQAQGTPLSYLSGVSSAYTQPLQSAAGITSGLGSGGQWLLNSTNTNQQDNPSLGADIMTGISAL